ncbi:hypothetical protein [Tolypothrix sp. NIES-4075]|nr:hypothetical protein [Tolypothrix sp. NIES-4075]
MTVWKKARCSGVAARWAKPHLRRSHGVPARVRYSFGVAARSPP